MKTIALVTALGLALAPLTTSTAFADEFTHDRYEGYERSHWHGDFHGRWVPLAQNYAASGGRQFISLNRDRMKFRKIRIEGTRGTVGLVKIAVVYADKTTQAVDLNDRMPAGTGQVIQLNNDRPINQIVIYTERGAGGRYSVYGA